jgi:hypothetical protein
LSVITLPGYDDAGRLVGDVAGQLLLEADARKQGMRLEREFVRGVLRYRFRVGVTGRNEERQVRVDFASARANPAVHVDGPPCLRHRWEDDSLCMWDPKGPASERWLIGDGLPSLAEHVRIHVHCEAQCRAGNPWPKEEMAGEHPRKRDCPTCRGRGR